MHPAFANAGKAPGLKIWRIEEFEPVPYPKNKYGKFHEGDSYIVLNTKQSKDKSISWDVHFWLGSETSTDEAGTAAILTVQLDDILNGAPVQHREVQDHESQLFLSYFKNGVRYEQGGVGSGFKHVQTNAEGEKRLFQVKGKRNVRVRQVNLSVSSMNKGDCFILDAGSEIYVYVGIQAKRVEKLKAISAANQIRDQDHNGRAKVNVIDEFSSGSDLQEFFNVLGSGSPDDVPDESIAEEDGVFESGDEKSVTLYKVTDESGSLKIDPVASKPLKQEMLDTRDCFILDTGSGIYVWVGKEATQKEKAEAMNKASEFLKTKKYPAWTQVHRIVQGAESAPFKQYFATWKDLGASHTRLIRSAMGYSTDDSDVEFDDSLVESLKKSGGRALGFMPDQGKGEIVRLIQFVELPDTDEVRRTEIPLPLPNQLLLGFGSYVILYDFIQSDGNKASVVYAWRGSKAGSPSMDEAVKVGMEFGDELDAVVVTTVQGHEPRHFLKMFKGKLITSYTGAPSEPILFRVSGTDETDVRANEVEADSSSLASDDVYALVKIAQKKVYIWVGLAASGFEKNMAEDRIGRFWPSFENEVIQEGAEPDDFWDDLNGEGIYDRGMGKGGSPILEPRLFHCRILVSGRIKVEEVPDFQQDDLDVDDVMLLDGGDEIYVWVGSGTTEEEQNGVFDMARKYIKMEPSSRTIETATIIWIKQGIEPKCFKRMFPEWNDDAWKLRPTYEEVLKNVLEKNLNLEENNV
ncbi:gelsolin isoform X2 [Episyrphus balteatus]|nr:gelsolin isoform X2 [Episyrphus balteatus]